MAGQRWQGSTLPNLALSDQGPGFAGQAARVLAALRATPRSVCICVPGTVMQFRGP
jgi:hypothetical protein